MEKEGLEKGKEPLSTTSFTMCWTRNFRSFLSWEPHNSSMKQILFSLVSRLRKLGWSKVIKARQLLSGNRFEPISM